MGKIIIGLIVENRKPEMQFDLKEGADSTDISIAIANLELLKSKLIEGLRESGLQAERKG